MADDTRVEDRLRQLAPEVLGAVVRRYGSFDLAEDAVQEALLAASLQWPREGVPDRPRAWLIRVASRRLTDLLRGEQARRRREDSVARWTVPEQQVAPAADRPASDSDDSLILLFLCCHPALSAASQIALTLRAVGGLTTAEIARAFLVPEATMTRRISRAKQAIAASGVPFRMPSGPERTERLAAVLHVLYLIFNEGYAATSGARLQRVELSAEAIRLARMVHRLLPDDAEVAGLLALMLLTDARRVARTGPGGALIPMADQDRSRWDAGSIAEGVALVTDALARGPVGPYQLQAAIAAVHDQAPDAEATDWPQILGLYQLLLRIADNPVVRLNHAVAVAMVRGRARASRWSTGSGPTTGSPLTTACTRSVDTCWRWLVSARRHVTATWRLPSRRPAFRSSATSTPKLPGWLTSDVRSEPVAATSLVSGPKGCQPQEVKACRS